jgi:hypothetical protein
MNYNTYYIDSTVCSICEKHLALDETGNWIDGDELPTCSATPRWNGTRLIGWDFTSHSPAIVEVK